MLSLISITNELLAREHFQRRNAEVLWLATKTPWSEDFKWDKSIVFDAGTWKPFSLFAVGADMPRSNGGPQAAEGFRIQSPCGRWTYDETLLPAGGRLDLFSGRRRGKAMFSEAVVIPRMWHGNRLWMSYVPNEVMTLRPALRLARGHVVIAGLGMGWLLSRVLAMPQVTKVTLVERDQVLCDWILPALGDRGHVDEAGSAKLSVVVADANEAVPEMTADVALWDIWSSLGAVSAEDRDDMDVQCPGIGKTWFWGVR